MNIMTSIDEIAKVILKSKKVLILPHVSADGDAIGSALALYFALMETGYKAAIYMEESIPLLYGFLPGADTIKVYNSDIVQAGEHGEFDMAIALDTGDRNRLGKRVELFDSSQLKVNIDHHSTNTMFGMYNYVDIKASAVGEIIYRLIKKLKVEINKVMATCLYVAIATDTGGFRFSNTTSDTHIIAAELINHGVDIASTSRKVFDSLSYEKVKLMGEAINSITVFEDGKAAMIVLTDDMISRTGASEEDFDGIVDIARRIRGVEIAVLLRSQPDGTVKGNLRSNERADVAAIASGFGGGGHIRAAGFTTKISLNEVIKKIKEQIAISLTI